MDSSQEGMNSVAMTIINHRKENWPSRGSNQRPPVLKSCMLSTELWDSAQAPLIKVCVVYFSIIKSMPVPVIYSVDTTRVT